ncbi:MAG: arginine decarboxylase [Alphaproteobacteria bacterium]|nr:arginine decarboxylase [Alphaproteobacteria bacterium]
MIDIKNPFEVKILLSYDDFDDDTAAARAVRILKKDLEIEKAHVIVAEHLEDTKAIFNSDPSIQAVMLGVECTHCHNTYQVVEDIRKLNKRVPIFLMSSKNFASDIPTHILEQVSDFIWLLEDTLDFISGRVQAAVKRYRRDILPPMFKALAKFAKVHEYSWHTPGHTGGTAFLKTAVGRDFFNFFGEQVFRSDLSISVSELGSMLDHSGPIGESEKYMAKVFNSSRSYHITNGTSTSNRVVLMASLTRGDICLCDRNCHKSVEHAMTMTGAVPTYLMPTRNQYGIIGPILPETLTANSVREAVKNNKLVKEHMNHTPKHVIITNSTYDGLCYNTTWVRDLLKDSVDRIHFDEAWYGYARFNPIYQNRYAMCCNPQEYDKNNPTIFATQSTHKLLAAFSQASMIHILDGKNSIAHERFNESLMMHSSTSPFYAIIASNDVSSAMMDSHGKDLTQGAIKEAVYFRKTLARINDEMKRNNTWFFNVWQPDTVINPKTGEKVPFFEAEDEWLETNPDCWILHPNDAWHGFGDIADGYTMLDPIKVSVTTPGVMPDGSLADFGIPATLLTAYLDSKGIVVEKTTDFTCLFLFSFGVTKGKWGTLLNALFEFKKAYDYNVDIKVALPKIYEADTKRYAKMGLRDLSEAMFLKMKELNTTKALANAFSELPEPDMTPVEAYEKLVKNEVEALRLDEMVGQTVATGVVPYPPGIPLLMPGENAGLAQGSALTYLKALEAFDEAFPEFSHDIHGVEVKDGKYRILCVKK